MFRCIAAFKIESLATFDESRWKKPSRSKPKAEHIIKWRYLFVQAHSNNVANTRSGSKGKTPGKKGEKGTKSGKSNIPKVYWPTGTPKNFNRCGRWTCDVYVEEGEGFEEGKMPGHVVQLREGPVKPPPTLATESHLIDTLAPVSIEKQGGGRKAKLER